MDRRFEQYVKDVPVIPAVAAKVLSIAEGGLNISFRELENIIKMDPGLTARILKIANSAQYARQREITQLQSAITLLGFKTIRSVVLLVTASGMFSRVRNTKFYREHWYHSLLTAFLAKLIAVTCRAREISEEAFLAGLFHDIGRVPLYASDPARYEGIIARSRGERRLLRDVEAETLGTDHQQLGAAILDQWSFPPVYVDTAAEHDSVNITSPHKSIIIMVSVANCTADLATGEERIPQRVELLSRLVPYSCLKQEDVDAFVKDLPGALRRDPLFAECLGLYGVSGA